MTESQDVAFAGYETTMSEVVVNLEASCGLKQVSGQRPR